MKYASPLKISLLACLIVTLCNRSIAQDSAATKSDVRKQSIKNMIDSQHFTFIAQSVTPLRGRFRNLTSIYDVRIKGDTLKSYLPYFGRAFSAPINETESPLDFTSTDFSYTVTPGKKSGWNVLIKPRNDRNVQQLMFTIYDNGSASLNVNSISRDPISFNGYIQSEEKKKKKK